MCMGMCKQMQVLAEVRGLRSPWSWNYCLMWVLETKGKHFTIV